MNNTAVENVKKFFKEHPMVGMLIAMVLTGLFGVLITNVIPGAIHLETGKATMQGAVTRFLLAAVASFTALILYCRVSGRELKSFLTGSGMGRGILMGWSVLFVNIVLALLNLMSGCVVGDVPKALLLALVAGIGEEVVFRLIPLSVVLDADCSKKTTVTACVVSGICFGLSHLVNISSGANPSATMMQILYATVLGVLLAGIYVRTKNVWAGIFLHTLMDFRDFVLVAPGQQVDNVVTDSVNVFQLIVIGIIVVLFLINAIVVIRKYMKQK